MTDILSGFLDFAFSALNGFFSDMPVYSIPDTSYSAVTDGMQTIYDLLVQVNFLIPLDQICIMIGIDLGIRVVKFSIFAINWIVRRVCDVIP